MPATEITTQSAFILQNLDLTNSIFEYGRNGYIVLFKMEWCGHCTKYMPIFNNFSETLKEANVQCLYLEGTTNELILNGFSNLMYPAFVLEGFPTVVLYNKSGEFVEVIKNRFKLEEYINTKL